MPAFGYSADDLRRFHETGIDPHGTHPTPQPGDRVYFYGRSYRYPVAHLAPIVCGILAERAISPLTGNPRYRVVDTWGEARDPEAGRWIGIEDVYGIFPPSED